MKISVIIPVYNEVNTLRTIVERVRSVKLNLEIVLVDDCSTDGTRDIYEKLAGLVDKIVMHDVNQGKGAAIRTGLKHVTGDVTVVQDADLEYDPEEYHILLQPLLDGKADVVYGSRFLAGQPHRVLYFWHSVGNRLLTLFSNMMTNLNLTDMETCYKMARTDLFKCIEIEQNRFGFEPEITAKFAKMHDLRIYEVGISYDGRSYAAGKKIGYKDGFNALWCILKYARGSGVDIGKGTLQLLESFDAYANWMFARFTKYINGQDIIEIGSGIGNNVKQLIQGCKSLKLTDCREDYLDLLRKTYKDNERISVSTFDLQGDQSQCDRQFDTVICVNVLEHVENDVKALENMTALTNSGGHVIILVPAHEQLFCHIDKSLDHKRRYSMNDLKRKCKDQGLTIVDCGYFNTFGALGWWLSGKLFQCKKISNNHVKLQKLLMPISKLVDSLGLPFGLSVYCIAQKNKH